MNALEKEWRVLRRAEEQLRQQAMRRAAPGWKAKIEERIPEKLMTGLESAFEKAFTLIFEKGTVVIERTYRRGALEKDFKVRDYAVDIRRGRRELGKVRRSAGRSNALTTVLTTVEGVGLGALGIGLPDVAVWVAVLLRSVYETALKYGFSYDTPEERLFILKMMEASMSTGSRWSELDRALDDDIRRGVLPFPSEEEWAAQLRRTSDAFAAELLAAKFVQGLPVVGIVGGAANPVYYQKVMRYVQLKYRKRYLVLKRRSRLAGQSGV